MTGERYSNHVLHWRCALRNADLPCIMEDDPRILLPADGALSASVFRHSCNLQDVIPLAKDHLYSVPCLNTQKFS